MKVLIKGSFKHYNKVCKVHGLSIELKPLNYHTWISGGLTKSLEEAKKCC